MRERRRESARLAVLHRQSGATAWGTVDSEWAVGCLRRGVDPAPHLTAELALYWQNLREAARLTGRDVLVRMACQSFLADLENPPRGKAAGPLTAVALVLRPGCW